MYNDLNFSAFGVYNRNIYFSNMYLNGLFCLNTEDSNCEFIGYFPGEEKHVEMLHRCAVEYENYIIFIPYHGTKLNFFDTETKNLYVYDLCCEGEYIESYIFEDVLYMIPGQTKYPILLFDLKKREYLESYFVSDIWRELGEKYNDKYIIRTAFDISKIWFSIMGTNIVCELNLENMRGTLKQVPVSNVCSVCKGINGLWVIPEEGNKIYKFKVESDEIKEYDIPINKKNRKRLINYVIETHDYVIAMPAYETDFYVLEKGKKETFRSCFHITSNIDTINFALSHQVMTITAKEYGDIWIIPPVKYKKMIGFCEKNMNFTELEIKPLEMNTEVYNDYLAIVNQDVQKEGVTMCLKDFISSI